MPTSHIRFRVNIKCQLQKSALNISSKLQVQTSTSTAKVIFKVNLKLSLKSSTKSNFNFKVKLQLQNQTLMLNIKLQSQTSNFDKLSLHNVWRSVKTSSSTKYMVYWAFILKIKKGHGWTDGLSDIVTT